MLGAPGAWQGCRLVFIVGVTQVRICATARCPARSGALTTGWLTTGWLTAERLTFSGGSSGRADRMILVIGAHGPNAQEDHHDDDEHEYYQADHEEKHSTTQQAMAAWLRLARHTWPLTWTFPRVTKH